MDEPMNEAYEEFAKARGCGKVVPSKRLAVAVGEGASSRSERSNRATTLDVLATGLEKVEEITGGRAAHLSS